jgi:hypothetical protein
MAMREILLLTFFLLGFAFADAQGPLEVDLFNCESVDFKTDSLQFIHAVRIYDTCLIGRLGEFSNLRHLNAYEIGLQESFPPYRMEEIRSLNLQNNQLRRINCIHLPQLEFLDISGNPIDRSEVLSIIDSLPHLKRIRIGGCPIRTFELPYRGSLRSIDFCCETELESIFGGKESLSLDFLGLAGCYLAENIVHLRKSKIDSVDLSFNEFLSFDFKGLPSTVKYLDLSNNLIRHWKGSILNLRSLEELVIQNNSYAQLPKQISFHHSLKSLEVEWSAQFDLGTALADGQLPRHLVHLKIHLPNGTTSYEFKAFKGMDSLEDLSFFDGVPSDLSGINALPSLKRIRFSTGNVETFMNLLAAVEAGRKLQVWVPWDIHALIEKFPKLEFYTIEE